MTKQIYTMSRYIAGCNYVLDRGGDSLRGGTGLQEGEKFSYFTLEKIPLSYLTSKLESFLFATSFIFFFHI